MPLWAADLIAFALAVVAHWGAYVTGGVPWVADETVKRLSGRYEDWSEKNRPLRRKITIAALLIGVVFASFQAWQDERNHASVLQDKQAHQFGRAQYWRGLAIDRQKTIVELQNQPPKVVVQKVRGPTVQVPVVLPSGGQQLSPEQLAKVQNIRIALGNFLAQGNDLKAQASDPKLPDPLGKANVWANDVEGFLGTNLDQSYIQRFRDPSGLNSQIVIALNSDQGRQNEWWGIYVRTVRLNQFITELSK